MPIQSKLTHRLTAILWVTAALAAGAWLRLYFISSHGTWDTEYRKAWAHQAAEAGLTQVYGPAEAVPEGEFWGQLTGRIPRWEVSFRDKTYVIDYPPLALAVWQESWRFFTSKPRPYRGDAAENLAVKFPPVLGDLLAVGVLVWAFRGAPRTGVTLAVLYWVFPITWVSSAVHGNFDGFVPPFLLVSLLLAPTTPALAGASFAVSCLIKPTAAVALPVLFLATPRSSWTRIAAAGALITTLVFVPYALSGTLPIAIIQIARIFSQERLSGGYANPWWIVGHASMVLAGEARWTDAVDYVRRDAVAVPAGLIGFLAAGIAAAFVLYRARRITRPRSIVYVGALLLFIWGVLTVGVHDNHNHPLFLLLVATGLGTPFLRGFTFTAATSTLLGSLCLHGLGRFYGAKWRDVLPIADRVARMRMAPGFDLTLLLSVVNCALLAAAMLSLERTLDELEAA